MILFGVPFSHFLCETFFFLLKKFTKHKWPLNVCNLFKEKCYQHSFYFLLRLLNNLFLLIFLHKYIIIESFLFWYTLTWLSLSLILKYTHLLVKIIQKTKRLFTQSMLLYSQAIYLQRTSDVDNDWNETKLNSNSTYESRDWEKYLLLFCVQLIPMSGTRMYFTFICDCVWNLLIQNLPVVDVFQGCCVTKFFVRWRLTSFELYYFFLHKF